ncbi:hypothetical protein B0H14DRAFT_2655235 [Mycena olivaceomarginata]|nr:hypothetical protein B0H14DRAFT_2655235 [Mycena olivaceomarginata]
MRGTQFDELMKGVFSCFVQESEGTEMAICMRTRSVSQLLIFCLIITYSQSNPPSKFDTTPAWTWQPLKIYILLAFAGLIVQVALALFLEAHAWVTVFHGGWWDLHQCHEHLSLCPGCFSAGYCTFDVGLQLSSVTDWRYSNTYQAFKLIGHRGMFYGSHSDAQEQKSTTLQAAFKAAVGVSGLVLVGPTLSGRPILEGGDTESVMLVHGFYNGSMMAGKGWSASSPVLL